MLYDGDIGCDQDMGWKLGLVSESYGHACSFYSLLFWHSSTCVARI